MSADRIRSWLGPFGSAPLGAVVLVVSILLAGAILLFYHLGAEPLLDYDEATYVETTTESLASHNFLSFTYLGTQEFRKPPLQYWLAGAIQPYTSPEFAGRAPSALAALVLIGVVMLLVYAATGNAYAAAFGAGILLATAGFIEPSREVRFDILVSLFDALAVFAFFRAIADAHWQADRRWFIPFGLFMGLAVLSKGPLVLYAVVPCLVLTVSLWKWRWFTDGYFWTGVAVAALVALPWHLYETFKFGMAFWNEYIGTQVVSRVAGNIFGTSYATNADYFAYSLSFAAPWAELFCVGALAYPFLRRGMQRQTRALFEAVAVAIVFIFGICLITQTKALSYLIPMYPFIAIAVAVISYEVYRRTAVRMRPLPAAAGVILFGMALWSSAYNGLHLSPYYAVDLRIAQEEQSIGQMLHGLHAKTFYVYNTTRLGSIMFYSGILRPPWIGERETLPVGSYILYETAQEARFARDEPMKLVKPLYKGVSLTLVKVVATTRSSWK